MSDQTDATTAMIRTSVLLDQLAQRVESLDRRLASDFVTTKELKAVTDGVIEIKQAIKDGLKKLADDADTTEKGFRELYVTKDQFEPVRRLVFGLVTIILTGVCLALLALVMKQGG